MSRCGYEEDCSRRQAAVEGGEWVGADGPQAECGVAAAIGPMPTTMTMISAVGVELGGDDEGCRWRDGPQHGAEVRRA